LKSSFTDILHLLSDRTDLSSEQARFSLESIIAGELSEAEIAAFLFGMRAKGETLTEMVAFTNVMKAAAIPVEVDTTGAVDVCGTGGDQSGTVNISTAVMFVVAGAGVPVLKHGNRSVSSTSGSVDVLEALGAKPLMHKEIVEECFRQTKMGFMFAPYFHPAMKHVTPVRRSMKMRTFFNMMGPLLNPANIKRQVIGAYSVEVARMIAGILSTMEMDVVHSVHSYDGLDELSVSSDSIVFQVKDGEIKEFQNVNPSHLGFANSPLQDLIGGDAITNAGLIKDLYSGRSTQGLRDVVLLNSAYAVYTAGKTNTLSDALELAKDSLFAGKALKKLNEFVLCTNDLAVSEVKQ
jgi:anthranilate phosphoribosyltransferase